MKHYSILLSNGSRMNFYLDKFEEISCVIQPYPIAMAIKRYLYRHNVEPEDAKAYRVFLRKKNKCRILFPISLIEAKWETEDTFIPPKVLPLQP